MKFALQFPTTLFPCRVRPFQFNNGVTLEQIAMLHVTADPQHKMIVRGRAIFDQVQNRFS